MSFMGGSSKALPPPTQKPLGLDESRASTNEQARPVPYVAGRTRVGVTWINDAFDIKTVAVTQSAGKGKTTTTGYNYYASMMALVCYGVVDGLEKIYFNGDEVWSGDISRNVETAENFVEVTITGYGKMRLYWGTEEQTSPGNDEEFSLAKTFQTHPPYKHQCYVIFHQLFFGFNQTNAPNVELVLRRHPKPTWMTTPTTTNVEGDCNPVAIIAEWLQNKIYGLGWSEDRLDIDALKTIAAQLDTEQIGLSPYITKQTGARQLITQLCEYFDGYALLTPEGKFKLGLIRKPADVASLPLIDERVLLEEPDMEPASWSGVKSKTWVKFTDSARAFKENALPYRDPGTALITTDNTPQTIERPWVTRATLAQMMAAALGRAAALPETGGEIIVRKSAALAAGALFRLSYTSLGIDELVMRVVQVSPGKAGSRELSLEVTLDRAYLNEPYYVPPDDGPVNLDGVEPVPFTEQMVIELPRGLEVDGKITVAAIAVRPNNYTTKYDVHLRRYYDLTSAQPNNVRGIATVADLDNAAFAGDVPITGAVFEDPGIDVSFSGARAGQFSSLANQARLLIYGNEIMSVLSWKNTEPNTANLHVIRGRRGSKIRNHTNGEGFRFYQSSVPMFSLSYDRIADHNGFAVQGTLTETYPASTTLIDMAKGFSVNLGDAIAQVISPSLNNALQDEVLVFLNDEIISLAEVEVLAGGVARLYGIRARYDTQRQTHATASKVYIIARAQLQRLTHASFLRQEGCAFKLQPTAVGKQADLATIDSIGLTLTGRIDEPLVPLNLRAFGDGRNPVYDGTEDIVLGWDLTDNSGTDFWRRFATPATDLPATVLDFYDLSGVRQGGLTTSPGAITYTYPLTTLATDFGGQPSFKVRATALKNGLKSRYYQELTIRKI